MARFFKSKWFGLLFVGYFLSFPQDAISRCRPGVPQATLLESIPPEAEGSPVIARVSILSVAHDPIEARALEDFGLYALAIVIDPIKGVNKDEMILIQATVDFCQVTINHDVKSFQEGYIAGKFDKDNMFSGFWNKKFEVKWK